MNGDLGELPWIVAFRRQGPQPPVFCVCAGGGEPLDYRDLALALPEEVPVYGFGVPPSARSDGLPTVERLAASYVEAVRARQEHGPYRLCGHSFGGLVVYEMARQLAAQGEQVELLALLDTAHPCLEANMSRAERLRFRATYLADRVLKYGRNLARGRVDHAAQQALRFVTGRCKRASWRIARLVSGGLGQPLRNDQIALFAAWHRYRPGAYSGRLQLLVAAERGREYTLDPTLGWRKSAAGPIEIHTVPGDHRSMMRPPHVQALAERLQRGLAAA